MTDEFAEEAWRKANKHWQRCVQCYAGGGERADAGKLCPLGRELLLAWERAERSVQMRVRA